MFIRRVLQIDSRCPKRATHFCKWVILEKHKKSVHAHLERPINTRPGFLVPLLDRIDIYRSAASYLIQGAARVVVDRDKHSTLKDDSHKLM